MTGPGCARTKKGRRKKHTPITSRAEQGAMGAALAAKRGQGKAKGPARAIAASMSEAQLVAHLHESAGKKLPERRGGNMQRKHYSKLRKENTRAYG